MPLKLEHELGFKTFETRAHLYFLKIFVFLE